VCFAPVLRLDEAARHPHNVARSTFVEAFGALQPAPAPRFSRTAPELSRPPAHDGQHTREVLLEWGIAAERVDTLIAGGAVRQA
jgi:alpha-methylacyl-CoA racemase